MGQNPPSAKKNGTGNENLAINDTWFRRWLTLLALKTTARLYPRTGVCVRISNQLIVKSDAFVDLTEAATMKFVAKNTSLPVPKIYCSFVHHGRTYIVMEVIQGHPIGEGWNMRPIESKVKLALQLKRMLEELRRLEPSPGTGVESCTNGSLFDSRMPQSDRRFGPFATIQDFHQWLRAGLRPEKAQDHSDISDEDWKEITDMAAKQDGPWPQPVFSHADLSPSNILVRGDDIVGIIDWEFSGWYPHYWEYTSAWTSNPLATEWQSILSEILDTQDEELNMEITRQRFWGSY
jgi:serine/threonine protein kinase